MPDWSFPEFEWDDANEEHLAERHGIYPDEAEEVFYNGPFVRRVRDRYRVYGQTNAGRYLFVVCVLHGTHVRVISARDMDADEKRAYERYR